jgi:hypothetical protein
MNSIFKEKIHPITVDESGIVEINNPDLLNYISAGAQAAIINPPIANNICGVGCSGEKTTTIQNRP